VSTFGSGSPPKASPPVDGPDPALVKWSRTPDPDRTITGTSASETLQGTGGNDELNGRGGNDTLVGGDGHDTYRVNSAGDKVVEVGGQGTDQIILSAQTYTMPENVDNLVVDRASGAQVVGNGQKNIITGDIGDDMLHGGWSADKLTGGGGNDTFVFRKGEAEGDVITDFDDNGDVLRFEGFDQDASLVHEGDVWTVQYAGGSDTFTLAGVNSLTADDWLFS
jgi:Ca2+-binding RTX toxin-like protein